MGTEFPSHYTGPTLGEIGEYAAIQAIVSVAPSSLNGDDAAVLRPPAPNTRTVATTDMLVESRHFSLEWSTPEEIGRKAIVQNFADIEAMGARPVAALLAVSAPTHTPAAFVSRLATGIKDACDESSAELVGGDLTAGEYVVIAVTAIGQLGGSEKPLTLDRARPGQRVVAAGKIGYSAAGLALLSEYPRDQIPAEFEPLVLGHVAPTLAKGRGVIARATGCTAMTDNSDGLLVDVSTIANHSNTRINLDSAAIAPDDLMCKAGELIGIDPWEWVLTGGEDHTLIATTAKEPPSGFRQIGVVQRALAGAQPVTVDGHSPKFHGGWVSF